VLPEDVHRAGDVTAARCALLLAGELAVTAHVEDPRIALPHRAQHLILRCEHALARTRCEPCSWRRHLTRFGRAALSDPLLDAAFHDRHCVVPVAPQAQPQARRVVTAFLVVADDERLVPDAETRHRIRELTRPEEHVPRMA